MVPFGSISRASISSLEDPNARSDPSKYHAQVPLVVVPRVAGVKARMSSSASPLRPGTVGLPVVEINILPSSRMSSASMFSLVASNPTSIPLKYRLKVPAVLTPREVASKRTISVGA